MAAMLVLFNHTLTEEQAEDARASLGVDRFLDPPEALRVLWAQVPAEVEDLRGPLAPVRRWLEATGRAGNFLLVEGDFGATWLVVGWALELGLVPVHATTRREAREERGPDGAVHTEHVFRHVRFRKFHSLEGGKP